MKKWASRYARRTLRRLGVSDGDADDSELGEGSTAVNPYLFLAKHGMAVAGAGGVAGAKLRPVADRNGPNTANDGAADDAPAAAAAVAGGVASPGAGDDHHTSSPIESVLILDKRNNFLRCVFTVS